MEFTFEKKFHKFRVSYYDKTKLILEFRVSNKRKLKFKEKTTEKKKRKE